MGELRPGLSGWMYEWAEVLELLAFWKPEQQAAPHSPIWRPHLEKYFIKFQKTDGSGESDIFYKKIFGFFWGALQFGRNIVIIKTYGIIW